MKDISELVIICVLLHFFSFLFFFLNRNISGNVWKILNKYTRIEKTKQNIVRTYAIPPLLEILVVVAFCIIYSVNFIVCRRKMMK